MSSTPPAPAPLCSAKGHSPGPTVRFALPESMSSSALSPSLPSRSAGPSHRRGRRSRISRSRSRSVAPSTQAPTSAEQGVPRFIELPSCPLPTPVIRSKRAHRQRNRSLSVSARRGRQLFDGAVPRSRPRGWAPSRPRQPPSDDPAIRMFERRARSPSPMRGPVAK
eukprot:GFKZ01015378.1.p1 GENE.GFKZ01015378.1~~GFKZ01015378.1.p1  ORF type:complete len:166 (+),score=1.53 GFKZ01015378.1:600-1097(+)